MKIKINGNGDRNLALTAILSLTVIEITALLLGFNGQLLRWTTLTIAALAGLMIPKPSLNQISKIIYNLTELMKNVRRTNRRKR